MTKRVYVDPWRRDSRPREFTQFVDSEMPYKVDFSDSATERGTSVSSVTWTSEGSQTLTVTNEAVSSDVATADVSSSTHGHALLSVEATYADGNSEKMFIRIRVEDPEFE